MRRARPFSLGWLLLATLGGCGDADGPQQNDGGPQCTRWVLEDEVTNARDLGGHSLGGDRHVRCGRIYRGGDLTGLTAAGCEQFEELAIRTVIDLRMASVQTDQPAASCVARSAAIEAAPLPKLLPDTPENYLALMEELGALAGVFATLGDSAAYPVYVHCVIGRDRASFVTALVLLALGADRQTVVDEFVLSEDAGIAVKPECIQAVLDEVDNRGGIETYLGSAGVAPGSIESLRSEVMTR